MQSLTEPRTSPLPLVRRAPAIDAGLIAAGYFVAELAAVLLSTPNAFLTMWPPNGLLCGMLLRRDRGRWPAILLASYPANLGFALLYGQPAVVGSAYWVANVAEVTLAALVLRRFWPDGLTLRDPRQVVGLAAATAGAAVVGCGIGAFATWVWRPDTTLDASAFSWWAADALGILTVAPIVLTWDHGRGADGRRVIGREAVALIVALVALAAATVAPIATGRHDVHVPFPILVVPLLTWAALRLGVVATAWSLLVFNSLTILRHLHGLGDVFAAGGFTPHNAAALQILLGSLGVTFLAIAAAAAQSRAAVASLVHRERQRADYLAEVTHEIRNPLSAILNGVEIAEHCAPGSPEVSHAFAAIKRGAARILAISDEVLMLSRDESRPELLQREACWLPAVWRALQVDCATMPRAPGVELQWRTPAPSVTLEVDRRRLEVVVQNLVGNALKFTDHGVVEVSCALGGHDVVITVRDTGIGIADVDKARLFELFERGRDPRANARRGTGVGLHTVRRYARQLGGDVSVSSVYGVGSTFEVRLPTRMPEAARSLSG